MRLHEVLTEDQLDEISLGGIGRGIARGAGAVARGVGSVVGGVKGTMAGIGKSYTTSRDRAYAAGMSAAGPGPYTGSTPATTRVASTTSRSASTGRNTTPTSSTAPARTPSAASSPASTGRNTTPTSSTAVSDPYEQMKGQLRSLKSTGTKVLPAAMATNLTQDLQKLSKGDKDSGAYAADKILKFANAGYNVDSLAQQWLAMSKAGERFLTRESYEAISALLRENNLRWADIGLRIRMIESTNDGVFVSRKLSNSSLDLVF